MITMRVVRLVKKTPWLREFLLFLVGKFRPPITRPTEGASSLIEIEDCPAAIVEALQKDGASTALRLRTDAVEKVIAFSHSTPCYADRDPTKPFRLSGYEEACERAGKDILVAQYFNTASECTVISELTKDARLRNIADRYLGAESRLLGVNLWWTFACSPTDEDLSRHAQLFHYDIDDLKFLKVFFYLTDVSSEEGAHVYVRGSHRDEAFSRPLFSSPRISDKWVAERFSSDIVQVTGSAGSGLLEDTYLLHKGTVPKSRNRLMLQIEFGVLNLRHQSDRVTVNR